MATGDHIPGPLLVIGATPFELEPLIDALAFTPERPPTAASHALLAAGMWRGRHIDVRALGLGKTATAAGLARALERGSDAGAPYRAVVQLGIGGTYAGSFLPVGGVAVAETEHDLDVGVAYRDGWAGASVLGFGAVATGPGADGNRIPVDAGLTRWLSDGGRVPTAPFGTSDAVSGDLEVAEARRARFDLAIESMEGSAAAQTALAAGVAFAELRGISNVAGQRDKGTWEIRAAVRAATRALLAALGR